tara:strand:- start:1081 stop:1527 length:447 start_codon:yes stop_codon:yes gene_type:complete
MSYDMSYDMSKDKQISLILSRLIPIDEIRYRIIHEKNIQEKSDAMDYHVERVRTIARKYYASFSSYKGSRIHYSLIIDKEVYEAERDRNLMFYEETGISFQVRSLLLDILKYRAEHRQPNVKAWRETEDSRSSFLAKKIMEDFMKRCQ